MLLRTQGKPIWTQAHQAIDKQKNAEFNVSKMKVAYFKFRPTLQYLKN